MGRLKAALQLYGSTSGHVLVASSLLAAAIGAQSNLNSSLLGSARTIIVSNADARRFGQLDASSTFAPFVTDNLQLGVGFDGQRDVSGGASPSAYYAGSIGGFANYFFGHSRRSRPYVGPFAAVGGGTGQDGFTTLGVQVGWLHFLTPGAALRAEYRYRQSSRGGPPARYVLLYLDPYLGGRASSMSSPERGFGSTDLSVQGYFDPTRDGQASGDLLLAPFFTRWFQLGGNLNYAYFKYYGITAHQIEGFGRLYAPLDSRVVPFVGGFVEAGDYSNDVPGLSTYGPFGGLRTYLSREVALDLGLRQTRHKAFENDFGRFRLPHELRLTVQLVTHLRLRRTQKE